MRFIRFERRDRFTTGTQGAKRAGVASSPSSVGVGRIGLVLLLALLAPVVDAVSASAQAPASYDTLAPEQLVARWGTAPRQERPAIAHAMVARRGELSPVLSGMVRNGSTGEKMFACSMIAELRDRAALDDLLVASADGDVRVRRRAATVLRILADPRSAGRLRQILGDESDPGVVKSSLAALGRIGSPRDGGVIAAFLTHPDHGTRVVAAAALAMLGDESGLEIVVLGSEADDPAVRKSATYALGFFSADAAGVRLGEILDDPDGEWKAYARIAETERRLAEESPSQQIETLADVASGRSRTAAEWAVDRLTDIGGAGAVEALRQVRDRETPVGAKAGRRLIVLGGQP